MFKRIKTFILAILMAMIFPVFRITGNNDTPPAPPGNPPGNPTTPPGDPPAPPTPPPNPATRVKELEGILASKDTELSQAKEKITTLEKAATDTNTQIDALDGSLKKAVIGYRTLIIQNNPDILPEMVTGDSMEALEGSLAKAKDLTNKIKIGLQNQAKNTRVPAGAPQRGPTDNSGLSPTDKIKQGLNRK